MESSLKIEFAKKVVISLVKSPIYKEVSPNTDEEIKNNKCSLNKFNVLSTISI